MGGVEIAFDLEVWVPWPVADQSRLLCHTKSDLRCSTDRYHHLLFQSQKLFHVLRGGNIHLIGCQDHGLAVAAQENGEHLHILCIPASQVLFHLGQSAANLAVRNSRSRHLLD